MLAARDQENLVHSHQVTASAKPLNQGAFKAVPKTPGAKPFKTPFKVPLNDENGPAVPGGGKSKLVIEARQDGPAVKQGRLDKSAFITPFGPRNRAPLGMKTTNAKTRAFQTPTLPAPTGRKGKGNDNLQGEGDTLRRIKPIVDDADTATVKLGEDQHDLEEREIEYMPPKAKDLPDFPDDIPHDIDYPQLRGKNLTRGWYQTYCNPIGEDGLSEFDRRMQEQEKRADKVYRELTEKAFEETPLIGYNVPELPGDETIVEARKRRERETQQQQSKVLTTKARSVTRPAAPQKLPSRTASARAAALLSKPADDATSTSTTTRSAHIAPAPKSKLSSFGQLRRKEPPPPTNPSSMRHAAATATSRTTLGYSKGRQVSSSISRVRAGQSTTVAAPKDAGPSSTANAAEASAPISAHAAGREDWLLFGRRVGAFDGAEDEGEAIAMGLRGLGFGEGLPRDEEAENDFQLTPQAS